MYCPNCRSEYREGFTHCSDCDVDLVAALPPDKRSHDVNPVKVYETGDASIIPLVQSLLEDAGIEYEVLNTARQYVTNSQLGYAEFWVPEDRAEEARAVLAELAE